MAENSERYYQHSGKIPFAGTLSMLGLGAIAALGLGFIYAAICRINPIIILQILVTLAYGAGLGMAIRLAGRWTKVRNAGFATLVSLFIGSLGVYFAWVWYIFILAGWDVAAIQFEPTTTWEIVKMLAANGTWSFKGAVPTGWQLYLFWGIEASIILFVCYAVGSQIEDPFCEECNCWTAPLEPTVVGLSDTRSLTEAIEAEQYDAIPRLVDNPLDPHDFLKLVCYQCPNCAESTYLKVSHVVTTLKDKDEPSVDETTVIRHIAVPDDVTTLVAALGAAMLTRSAPDVDLKEESDEAEETDSSNGVS